MTTPPPRSTTYELQFHPAGARGRIRYVRVSRAELRGLMAVAVLLGLFLVLGLALAPATLRSLLGGDRRAAAHARNAQLVRELRAAVSGLAALEARSRELLLAAQRFAIAYDLEIHVPLVEVDAPDRNGDLDEAPVVSLLRRSQSLVRRLDEETSGAAQTLDAAESFQRTHAARVASTPSITPLATGRFVVTSPFGERLNPFTREREMHSGLDLAAPAGSDVRATADGVVLFAGLLGEGASTSSGWFRYGKICIVEHEAGFVTLYGHLDEVRTVAGRRVRRSDVLGTVGNTGWTTHPHLHYEVRRRRAGELRPADPRAFFLGIPDLEGDRMSSSTELSKVLLEGYEPLPDLSTLRRSP